MMETSNNALHKTLCSCMRIETCGIRRINQDLMSLVVNVPLRSSRPHMIEGQTWLGDLLGDAHHRMDYRM